MRLKHRIPALALAATLAAGGICSAQDTTMAERLAAWRLRAATEAPSEALAKELGEICKIQFTEAEPGGAAGAARLAAEKAALREAQAEHASYVTRLAAAKDQASIAPADASMKAAVRAALLKGDHAFLDRMGQRAVPVLTALALSRDGSPLVGDELHPLSKLADLDPEAAADVLLELAGSSDFVVKREALNTGSRALYSDALYLPVGESDWTLKNEALLQILVRALQEPSVEPEALRDPIKAFVNRGVLPESAGDLAVANLTSVIRGDSQVAPKASQWLFVKLLEHPGRNVRANAVRTLASLGSIEEALPMASDPDPEVRLALAKNLLCGWRSVYTGPSRSDTRLESAISPVTDRLYGTFVKLVTDPVDEVRHQAWRDAKERFDETGEPPFDLEQYSRLLPRLPDGGHFFGLRELIPTMPEEDRLNMLLEVIKGVGSSRFDSPGNRVNAFMQLLDLEYVGLDPSKHFWSVVDAISAIEDGASAIRPTLASWVDRLVEEEGLDPVPFVSWNEVHGDYASSNFWNSRAPGLQRRTWISAVGQGDRLRLLRAHGRLAEEGGQHINIGLLTELNLIEDPGALLSLLDDPSAPFNLRFWALQRLMGHSPLRLIEAQVDSIATTLVAVNGRSFIGDFPSDAPLAELLGPILRAMLADEASPDEFLLQLSPRIPDDATLEAILKRFPVESWSTQPQDDLLLSAARALVARSTEGIDPRLKVEYLGSYALKESVAEAIGKNRTPALFPLALEILKAYPSRGHAWSTTVETITGYLNDDAAAALLEEAKSVQSKDQLEIIMASIRQITEWRDAAAAWEKSQGAEAKRAEAIAKLIVILDDASATLEARAAAMRGLGLLGAAEELPRIIAGLGSDEPEIQAAARATLARLEE